MGILQSGEREFIGFFMGEGCLMIQRVISWNSKTKNDYYRPVVAIGLRADDVAILKEFKRMFGGCLGYRKHIENTNPRAEWRLIGFKGCQKVFELLSQANLPYRKREEVRVFGEFLETAIGTGRKVTPQLLSKQATLKKRLSSLKLFNVK